MTALLGTRTWPVDTVAAGWTTASGRRETAGEAGRIFPLASVTKPLFAYAVLVAVEEGTLSLDGAAGPPGSTVRHLLSHASGLGDSITQALGAVGSRRIYSNAGFEVLGQQLEAASGFSSAEYLRLAVLEPLGMTATELAGSPAHGATSTVEDLLRLAGEWLRPTLLSQTTMADARTDQLGPLPGVLPGYGRQERNDWGLGFEIKGGKHPHWTGTANSPATFGHFGRSGTFLWVDPERDMACVALTDREFGPWAIDAWPRLSDEVLAE